MEIKTIEKDILNNISKSFNLNDLQNLINIAFEKFQKGKISKNNNQISDSNHNFISAISILKKLNAICNNQKCNTDIKKKINNAIIAVDNYISKNNVILKNTVDDEIEKHDIKKDISQVGSSLNDEIEVKGDAIESVKETLITGYKDTSEKIMHNITKIEERGKKNKIPEETDIVYNKEKDLFFLINSKYKDDLNKYFIHPLNYPELYKKNFNSLLLYGYRGNGKSFIAYNLISQIDDKVSIKQIINTKQILDNQSLIIELFQKINKLVEENENKKITLLIEDIEILIENCDSHYIYDFITKYSQKKNIFIVATSNSPWKLKGNIKNIFEKKICIDFPDIEDINKYFLYKIYEYVNINTNNQFNYENISELFKYYEKYNIPIIKNIKDINKLSKKCYDNKNTYYDLNTIINKLFNISAFSSIKNNIFQKEMLKKMYFINSSSIYEKNTQQYLITPPEYNSIFVDGNTYISYNSYHQNFHFDDERITNLYICNKEIKDNKLDMIGEIDIELSNNINKMQDNYNVTEINKIILDMYLHLFKNIFFNINNIITNDKTIYQNINSIITENINQITKINDLNDFLYLEDKIKDKIINFFEKNEIINEFDSFKKKYSKCLNTLIQTITLENDDYMYNISYGNKSSKNIEGYENGISSNMIDPNEIRKIIIYLLSDNRTEIKIDNIYCEIQITYLKKNNKYSWIIEIIPNYKSNETLSIDIFNITILNKDRIYIDISPSLDLPSHSIELNYKYRITNESDVFLLQEKFPEDYQDIYKDEPDTWMLKKIRKNKHLDYLQSIYNGYQKFFLNLYHNLLQYKQNCWGYLNIKCQRNISDLIQDIQIKIENILFIEQDYDESVEKEIENWKFSDNHVQNDIKEETNMEIIFKKSTSYSINFLIFKQLLEIMGQFISIKDILHYYHKSINGLFKKQKYKIFVKSKINLNKLDTFFYSNYLIEHKLIENKDFNRNFFNIINDKILKNKSLYFELFEQAEKIGYLEDNIKWYNFYNTNKQMQDFLKSGKFAISNRTIDFVQNIFKGICNHEMSNNILAYIISSLYLSEYKTNNIIKIYIGILLYNKNLILNLNNNEIKGNILDLLQKNIINHFSIIKERFLSLKRDIKNISIPEIPLIKNIFENSSSESSIEKNNIYYKNNDINTEENIKRKKIYVERVSKEFSLNTEEINASLISFNLKKEYLEEIIETYIPSHNIEVLNLIDEFN